MILAVRKVGSKTTSSLDSQTISKPIKGRSFQKILSAKIPKDPFKAMQVVAEAALKGKTFSPEQLLLFQVRANEFGMQVELVSKVAESANSSMKKLQQQG